MHRNRKWNTYKLDGKIVEIDFLLLLPQCHIPPMWVCVGVCCIYTLGPFLLSLSLPLLLSSPSLIPTQFNVTAIVALPCCCCHTLNCFQLKMIINQPD